jgi:hypothetical protein
MLESAATYDRYAASAWLPLAPFRAAPGNAFGLGFDFRDGFSSSKNSALPIHAILARRAENASLSLPRGNAVVGHTHSSVKVVAGGPGFERRLMKKGEFRFRARLSLSSLPFQRWLVIK